MQLMKMPNIKILLLIIPLLSAASFISKVYATPPSITVQKVLELTKKVHSESAAKQIIQENEEKIMAYLGKQVDNVTLRYRDGEANNFLEGKILEKNVEFKNVILLFDYMMVDVHNSNKVIIPTKGQTYFIRIPMVLRETYCLIENNKVIIKYSPGFSSLGCIKKKDENVTLCNKFNITFSEVLADNFIFFLDEHGNIYR